MRIRRSASKLLGLASTQPASPPRWASSSEHAASASAVDAAAGMFCQLNCSPWDAMPNLKLAMFFQEEEEEDRGSGGALGHGFEVKEEVYEDSTATALFSTHSESNSKREEEEEELEDARMIKTKKKKVSKGKGTKNQVEKGRQAAADVDRAVACKKTDGKGWHCKRLAQHPHSLCQYHLSQLRNYGAAQSNDASSTEIASEGKQSTRTSRKKSNATATADANFYYYYYSGFGPWRGKTRGGVGASREEAENGSGSSKASECTDVNEDRDAPVAGEDECALDEEDDDSEGCAEANCQEDNGEGKAKKQAKKRGRRPVKARSLKSLL